jgi:hypothetical protein
MEVEVGIMTKDVTVFILHSTTNKSEEYFIAILSMKATQENTQDKRKHTRINARIE